MCTKDMQKSQEKSNTWRNLILVISGPQAHALPCPYWPSDDFRVRGVAPATLFLAGMRTVTSPTWTTPAHWSGRTACASEAAERLWRSAHPEVLWLFLPLCPRDCRGEGADSVPRQKAGPAQEWARAGPARPRPRPGSLRRGVLPAVASTQPPHGPPGQMRLLGPLALCSFTSCSWKSPARRRVLGGRPWTLDVRTGPLPSVRLPCRYGHQQGGRERDAVSPGGRNQSPVIGQPFISPVRKCRLPGGDRQTVPSPRQESTGRRSTRVIEMK